MLAALVGQPDRVREHHHREDLGKLGHRIEAAPRDQRLDERVGARLPHRLEELHRRGA